MIKLKAILLLLSFFLLIGLISFFAFFASQMAPIMNGIAAKNLCSAVFVANIEEQKAKAEDIGFFPLNFTSTKVNYDLKEVNSNFFGFIGKRKAIYRQGLGCVLVNQTAEEDLRNQSLQLPQIVDEEDYFDSKDTLDLLTDEQRENLNQVLNNAFEESPGKLKNTRAVVILKDGYLIAEKYATGIDKNSKLLGWSMLKSITASLLGLLVDSGYFKLTDSPPIPDWKGTEKETITFKHLLNMNSGLRFEENYFAVSDVTKMLFKSDEMGPFAARLPLIHSPGTHWNYASGTTNIVAYLSSLYFNNLEDYQTFPYTSIFRKINMNSMLMETDAKGYFIGSSYAYATARDWSKFGLLCLQNGNWEGEQVLPEWWIDFIKQAVPESNGDYGGQFWLNAGGKYPDLPKDAFSMNGFQGQWVMMFPSKNIVITRMGLTYKRGDFDFNQFAADVLNAIE